MKPELKKRHPEPDSYQVKDLVRVVEEEMNGRIYLRGENASIKWSVSHRPGVIKCGRSPLGVSGVSRRKEICGLPDGNIRLHFVKYYSLSFQERDGVSWLNLSVIR